MEMGVEKLPVRMEPKGGQVGSHRPSRFKSNTSEVSVEGGRGQTYVTKAGLSQLEFPLL